jgi:hypothetical protein
MRVVVLLLLAFVCALMGWFFYAQSTGPGTAGEETSTITFPPGATSTSEAGQRAKQ